MADPTPASPAGAAPESPDALATAENAAGTAGRFVANAARTAAESVRNDAVTLVGKDVSVGARLEAGLNIAADVTSFVVGPEDAVAERAVVFGVKEVVGHAPQIGEVAVAGARAVGDAAPAIEAGAKSLAGAAERDVEKGTLVAGAAVAKSAVELGEGTQTAFVHLKGALEAAGHKIVDSDPARSLIETSKSVWHAVEGAVPDAFQAKHIEGLAKSVGKEMKTFAPNIDARFEELMLSAKNVVAKTETQLTRALEEKGLLKEGVEVAEHGVEHVSKLVEGLKTAKEIYEHLPGGVKRGVESAVAGVAGSVAFGEAKNIGHAAQHLAQEGEHRVVAAAQEVGHAAHDTVRGAEHVAHEVGAGIEHTVEHAAHGLESVGHSIADATKKAVDAVESWHPSMPFEKFGSLMAHIRGGSPTPTPTPDQAHTLAKTQAQQQSIGR